MMPVYLRDGRAPVPADGRVSAIMSRIRAKDTLPERTVRRALRQAGHVGYRLHYGRVPGRPDIAYVGRRIAVFVHGCFWHGCPHCRPRRPNTHTGFWNAKLDLNRERDARKELALQQAGWRVFTLWECRVRGDIARTLQPLLRALGDEGLDQRGLRPNNRAKKRRSKSQKKRNWPKTAP